MTNELQTTLDNILEDKNTNLKPENLKQGVTIMGVTGTLKDLDTSDATATADDILQNKIAYGSVGKVEGTMPNNGELNYPVSIIEQTIPEGYTTGGTIKAARQTNNDYDDCLELANDILYGQSVDNRIYGIKRRLNTTSSMWERTDDSINMTANATKNGEPVENDFDYAYIYKDIITQNYNVNTKTVVASYGDDNFTFAPEDSNIKVMTYIPEFYLRRFTDDDYEYIKIANYAAPDFIKIPARRVGRYCISGSLETPDIKSGVSLLGKASLSNLRAAAKNISSDFSEMDIWTWNILQILYLVEYANYNSQAMLGYGNVNSNGVLVCGECDSLGMKSGCLTNDKSHSVIYRGIENIFGNEAQGLDGLNLNEKQVFLCTDYTSYANKVYTGHYINSGIVYSNDSGYGSKVSYNQNYPIVMLPIEVNATDTNTGLCDRVWSFGDNRICCVGGSYSNLDDAGMFYYALILQGYSESIGRFVQYDTTAI